MIIAMACNFVAIISHTLEATPVRIPSRHKVKSTLIAVLVKYRGGVSHMTGSTIIKSKACRTLTETCPGCNFLSLYRSKKAADHSCSNKIFP